MDNRSRKVRYQELEDRRLLVAFGNAWANPDSLAISFVQDGAGIGDTENQLNATLDQVAERQEWQELVLRAYQTWSVHADINVALQNDHGNDFGAPGLATEDPRFGEFRIGAIPQVDVIANALPFQTIAGTYSGDIILNSSEQFSYDDWSDGAPVDQPEVYDLLTVLLHEAGNTLGIEDNLNTESVLFQQYTVPKGLLTAGDIQSIQDLYGARVDSHEVTDNGSATTATIVPTPAEFDPANQVLSVSGRILDQEDVDFYQVTTIPGQDSLTLRLRAQEISLLLSKIEVFDTSGQLLAESEADSVFANDHEIDLTGLGDSTELLIKVSGATNDVYAIGDYQLQVDYRSDEVKVSDIQVSSYDAGADQIFEDFDLLDDELGDNDTIANAVELDTTAGFEENTGFQVHSSISGENDVDIWKIESPDEVDSSLVINLAGVGLDQPSFNIEVVDSSGTPIGASGRLINDGTWRIQVAQVDVQDEMFLRVSVDPQSDVQVGNYIATAEFVSSSDQLHELSSGELATETDTLQQWTVNKSKLFRFNLSAYGGEEGGAVRLTIYDAHTEDVRLSISARSDVTRTAFVWLMEGDYIVRFSSIAAPGSTPSPIGYQLLFDGISDDTGDGNGEDITGYLALDPDYQVPSYSSAYTYYYYYYYGFPDGPAR